MAKIPDYSSPELMFYEENDFMVHVSFYDRHEKMYIPAKELPQLKLWEDGVNVHKRIRANFFLLERLL